MRNVPFNSSATAEWIWFDGVVSETLLDAIDTSLAKYGLEVEYCEAQDAFRIAKRS